MARDGDGGRRLLAGRMGERKAIVRLLESEDVEWFRGPMGGGRGSGEAAAARN